MIDMKSVIIVFYRPRSEASEGYVFTGVCHSVTKRGGGRCSDLVRGGKVDVLTWSSTPPLGPGHLPPPLGPGHLPPPPGPGHLPPPPPETTRRRAVRILLECILVLFILPASDVDLKSKLPMRVGGGLNSNLMSKLTMNIFIFRGPTQT